MKFKITLLTFFMALSMSAQTWTNVGNAGFSAGRAYYNSLVLDSNNVPYVAYQDEGNANKTTVMKFNGTSWTAVGSTGFSAGQADFQSLVLDSNNVPYVAYRDATNANKTTVMKFNGTNWVTVGAVGFSAGQADYLSLLLDSNNVPYVGYQDFANGFKATLMKFNGTSWVTVGSAGFSSAQAGFPDFELDSNNVPYVAYQDRANTDKATVMKFDGANWVIVGTAGFSAGWAISVKMALDNNNVPYVGYTDRANSYKTTVKKLNGTNWITVGAAGFSAGRADSPSLMLDSNNIPYIGYTDRANADKTTIMKFNGSAWVTVGTAAFSTSQSLGNSLTFDSNNVPYVGYTDIGTIYKATVKKFNPIQRTLTITPPTNGTVTANIPPPNGTTYNDGTVVALTATPASGYLFTGWSGDASGTTNPLNITMDSDKTVTATFTLITTTTWTGGAGGAWHIAGNWTNGTPSNTTNAIIPANNNNTPNPVVTTTTAIVNNLEIQSSRPFTINSGAALTIEGNLTQSGTIVVNTSATSNGSLILKGTTSGFVTYNRHTKTSNWHLMSSPVLSESISRFSSGYSTSGNKYGIASYDNALPSSRYVYYTTAAGANNIANAGHFVAGKGYSIKTDFASIFPFTGYINANDVSMAITDGGATGNKWNLVGNPFTASINGNANADAVNNFLTVNANQLDPNRVAMYVWNGTSYDIINNATAGSKYIAVAQGFFVESKDGGGTIQFAEAMQSHQTGDNFQRTSNIIPSIKLLVSNGDSQKSTDVKYFENSTTGLDLGYDAGVFSGDSMSFNVFTHLVSNTNKTAFALQCLPSSKYEDMVIPIGVNTKENTTLSFSVAAQNLPEDIHVYLEDKLNNTFTQIDKESHTVSFESKENGVGRFYMHTKAKKPSITDNPIINELSMFVSNDNILKVFTKEINQKASIKIIDLLGKEIFTQKFVSKGVNEIALPSVTTGIYIVRLATAEEGELSKKVLIK